MKRILKPTLVIIAVIVVGIILYPLFVYPRPNERKIQGLSSIKQLGTGTLIYVADYDEQFPIATQMPGLRATLFPYIKNAELFKEIPLKTGPKEFNFNFAAVNTAALPIGASTQPAVDETTIWYCISANKEKPGAFHSRIDSSVKFITLPTLFQTFQYQYPRKHDSLAPADYLADEDPLKEAVK